MEIRGGNPADAGFRSIARLAQILAADRVDELEGLLFIECPQWHGFVGSLRDGVGAVGALRNDAILAVAEGVGRRIADRPVGVVERVFVEGGRAFPEGVVGGQLSDHPVEGNVLQADAFLVATTDIRVGTRKPLFVSFRLGG